MSIKQDGGPAFPQTIAERPGPSISYYGLSVRDYFAAHAPSAMWPGYAPTMSRPEPKPEWGDTPEDQRDESPNNWVERAAWWDEYRRQYLIQWPYFYADAMLAARAK